jgi:hypothetical protein
MKDCATQYFARMETAVVNRRVDTLRQLAAMGPPFLPHPWVEESWTAAINSQIPDHISRERLAAYALAFRRVATERELQLAMIDHYAEVVGGRLIDNPTPEISYAQLAALDKLKAEHGLTLSIAASLLSLHARQLGVTPELQYMADHAGDPARCEKQLKAIAP